MSVKRTVRYPSLKEVPEAKTDWQRVDALTDEDIGEAVTTDVDAAPIADEAWFNAAKLVMPRKERITIGIDADVLAWFRHFGRGYQTRMNAVLRAFMEHQQRQQAAATNRSRRPAKTDAA
jgi:uncharacterized protein (DUF4415 family)